MFGIKKNNHTSTIIIDGIDAVINTNEDVVTVWQQRLAPSSIGHALSNAITDQDSTVDVALLRFITTHGMSLPQNEPSRRIHYSRDSPISGNVWHHGSEYNIALKASPDVLLAYCDLSENERESITLQLHTMLASGSIIVAIATALLPHEITTLSDLRKNEKLSFVGFASIPVSVSGIVRQRITQSDLTGKHLYMCSGQQHLTTLHIAQQLGLASVPSDVFDARRLDTFNHADLENIVTEVNVFSHCTPDNKKQILAAVRKIDHSAASANTPDELNKLLAN